ncbi:hypothetical protein LNP17_11805 [Klebsiella variicola subsp. variicola]|nr:hypothetical protein [Klebsiella variicola subsp. variicola]
MLQRLTELNSVTLSLPGWAGLDTNVAHVADHLELAESIRQFAWWFCFFATAVGRDPHCCKNLIIDANDLLGSQGVISALTRKLRTAIANFNDAQVSFCNLIKPAEDKPSLPALRDCALNILQHQSALKARSDWSRVREEAISPWPADQ